MQDGIDGLLHTNVDPFPLWIHCDGGGWREIFFSFRHHNHQNDFLFLSPLFYITFYTMTTTPNLPSLFLSTGSQTTSLSNDEVERHIQSFLSAMGTRSDVLILPPDFTRFHSHAGEITRFICEYYNFVPRDDDCGDTSDTTKESFSRPKIQIIPALGTIYYMPVI